MHELNCPTCNTPSQYDFKNYLLVCSFCSATFRFQLDTGEKEVYNDHYIIPTTIDAASVKNLVQEWLKRMHHQPGAISREYFITDIQGVSIPFWVISLEAHTLWKGLVRKHGKSLEGTNAKNFIEERGNFFRSYRWCVSSRKNIFEYWGVDKLHVPKENIRVDWDGFPLDSTFSRGRITEPKGLERSAYDVKEFFEYKFSNGLPILDVETSDEEALRRARLHVDRYHFELAKLNVDSLLDYETIFEIAGIQLIHLPFWQATYIYSPDNFLRHIQAPKERNLVFEGYSSGVLKGELAIVRQDKLQINAIICLALSLFLMFLGIIWHPAFFLVSIFTLGVAGVSYYISSVAKQRAQYESSDKTEDQPLKKGAPKLGKSAA